MKSLLPLLFVLLWGIGPAAAQGRFKAASGEQVAVNGARRALLIGIDRYADPTFPPLRFAARDASALGAVLRDPGLGAFDSVETMVVGELSARVIVARIEAWARTLGPEDTALLYWSGHGTRWTDGRGRSRVFLATEDSKRDDPIDTAVPVEALQALLSDMPATRRVLVLDACFTGSGKVDADDVQEAVDERFDERFPVSVRSSEKEAALFATTYGRPALESKSLGHGVFTYHLIRALGEEREKADADGDLVVTVSEAFDWARDQAMQATAQRQVPMAIYKIVGREELVLSGDPSRRAAARLAAVTAYEGAQHGVRLVVDGQERGAFPRTVLVEPGPHVVEFRTPAGKVIDRGRHDFRLGGVYSAAALRDALNGGRHQIAVGYQHLVLPGEAWRSDKLPHAPGVRLSYDVRLPSRNPMLRRLGIGVDLGFSRFSELEAQGGHIAPPTTAIELAAGPFFRLDLTGFLLQVQPRVAVMTLLRHGPLQDPFAHWVLGAVGADFALGARPDNRVSLRVHYAPMFFNADLRGTHTADTVGGAPIEVYHRLAGVVAIGF